MDYIGWLRQFRIGPFPIFDLILAYVGIFLLSPVLTKLAAKLHLSISRLQWIWLTLPIGIAVHLLIGQQTPLTKMFIDINGYYLIKIIILFMTFMGLKDVLKSLY